jgi:cysteine-S-conjugate beta-lyase
MTSVIRSLPEAVAVRAGLFGMIATREGFAASRDWLDATVAAIEANFALLETQLAAKLPGARLRRATATYLAWLDLSGLGWGDDPARHALDVARVALVSGLTFGRQGAGYARMNLACAPEMIVEAVDRLAAGR